MRKSRFGLLFSLLLLMAVMFTAVQPVSGEPSNTVRVWVTYQKGGKISVLNALSRQDAEIHYDFPELDAYVVTLPEAALNGIWRNPFVIDIEPDPVRYPIEPVKAELSSIFSDTLDVNGQTIPWGIDAVQARDVWDTNRNTVVDSGAPTGAGITVCIIDSGYYAEHEDLKDASTGISQVDDDYQTDGSGHGSHVAGTIGALNNSVGVVGVSPGDVNYHIVKIFNNDGVWASGSDLVAAIYNCRDNGANVISMSMGGASSNRREQRAFDTLYSNGILHIAAAGNEQEETPGLMSYPASYGSVISVAAVDSNLNIASFSNQNSAVEIAAPGVGVLSTIPYIETNSLIVDGTEYTPNHIEFSAFGSASGELVDGGLCTSSGAWDGKVVLCQRGDISFLEKVTAVYQGGGAAAIVYNNEPGNFLGTLGEEPAFELLAISLSQEDGQFLVSNKLGAIASLTSTHTFPTSGYEAWDGTSMATPHVSGVAALIWSANPSWTNVEIREAMNATAFDLGVSGRDSIFGYGLVQAADALTYLGGGTVDSPPTVEITFPSDGSVVSGTVNLAAEADDDYAVTQVAFLVDGVSIGTDIDGSDGWSVNWDTTLVVNGLHALSAVATDTSGKTGEDSISISVDNGGGTTDPIVLSATAAKIKGAGVVYLNWSPVTSPSIEIIRNGITIDTIENAGTYTDDSLGKGGGSATYQVCEAGTDICSNEVNVTW